MAITDVQTANVVVSRTGTGWTVDVTDCNLLPDLTIKDFIVLQAGNVVPVADYAKATSTQLVYSGTAVPTDTSIEVRRETPVTLVKVVQFSDRFASDDWNNEFAYRARWQAEGNLNGKGPGSTVSSVIPLDDPFGVAWDGDTVRPATRNALYDVIVGKSDNASPVFTGDPQAPTPLTADNDTSIATTAYVKNNLVSYATLASPTFTGNPAAPNPAYGLDSTALATTAYVRDLLTPCVAANMSVANNFPNNTLVNLIYDAVELDTDSMYNNSTGVFTIPTGRGGWYMITSSLLLDGTAITNFTVFIMNLNTAAGGVVRNIFRFVNSPGTTTSDTMLSGTVLAPLVAGTGYKTTVSQLNASTTTATTTASTTDRNKLFVMRLPF